MGLFGKIATLASVGLPAKAAKNAITGRATTSATKTTGAASGGTPSPPPPPGAPGAGGSAASRAKTMAGGTGGFTPSAPPPPPPKAGQNVYAAGADFKKTKPEPVRNAWREGGKK